MAADNPMMQVELRQVGGSAQVLCWLPVDSRLSIGTILTLRETGETEWRVSHIYDSVIVDRAGLHKPWRVGGLR